MHLLNTTKSAIMNPLISSADGGRCRASHAAQVCVTCKTRKKKCDKLLPHCGYCVKKGLSCRYGHTDSLRNRRLAVVGSHQIGYTLASEITLQAGLAESEASLYIQVLHLIRETDHYVDEVSARYFANFHRYMPFISRARFQDSVVALGSNPPAGVSALLLGMCLVTSSPATAWCNEDGGKNQSTKQRSLYLATKSLLAQIQVSFPPTLHLIQACLLLAIYEYTDGRPDDALTSVVSCARLAYRIGIHTNNRLLPPTSRHLRKCHIVENNTNFATHIQAEESANTWWGVVICERLSFCEEATYEQPLLTVIADGNLQLPVESTDLDPTSSSDPSSKVSTTVSHLRSDQVGAFGRTAQAVWILDNVFATFKITSIETRLALMQDLHIVLQDFLRLTLEQCSSQGVIYYQHRS